MYLLCKKLDGGRNSNLIYGITHSIFPLRMIRAALMICYPRTIGVKRVILKNSLPRRFLRKKSNEAKAMRRDELFKLPPEKIAFAIFRTTRKIRFVTV